MITFIDAEKEVDGIQQWLSVSSEYSDLVVFEFGYGGPVDLKDPEDNKRYLSYAIFGSQLVDVKNFAYTGIKAPWMGKDNSIIAILLSGEQKHIWVDFEDRKEFVIVSGGHSAVGLTEETTTSFSHVVSKHEFLSSADQMYALYSEINA